MDIADIVFDTEMTDDCLFTDDEFTKICDNREQYLQLSEVEQEYTRLQRTWPGLKMVCQGVRVRFGVARNYVMSFNKLLGLKCAFEVGRVVSGIDVQDRLCIS